MDSLSSPVIRKENGFPKTQFAISKNLKPMLRNEGPPDVSGRVAPGSRLEPGRQTGSLGSILPPPPPLRPHFGLVCYHQPTWNPTLRAKCCHQGPTGDPQRLPRPGGGGGGGRQAGKTRNTSEERKGRRTHEEIMGKKKI